MSTIYALPKDAADWAGVRPGTLRQWVRRGHIPPTVDGCYDMLAIEAYGRRRDAGVRYGQALACHRRRVACGSPRSL